MRVPRKTGWVIYYMGALVIALVFLSGKRAEAWCNPNGSFSCNGLLSPCPYYCNFISYTEEWSSWDCPDPAICMHRYCWITVPDYTSYACVFFCYISEATGCRGTLEA